MESIGNGESLKNLEATGKLNSSDTDRVDSLRYSSGVGGDARARRLGKLEASNTAIFMCDIQERFASSIAHFETIVSNTQRILKVANMLAVPVVATEQYPKGLGATVEPLKCLLQEQPISKTQFTMLVGDVEHRLDSLQRQKPIDTIILVGIETHVCIIATCIDLIHRGLNVHIIADAVSSRTQTDRHLALDRMRSIGAHISTTESVILSLVGDASHPNFKEVQRIIKNVSPDTGLIQIGLHKDPTMYVKETTASNENGSLKNVQSSL